MGQNCAFVRVITNEAPPVPRASHCPPQTSNAHKPQKGRERGKNIRKECYHAYRSGQPLAHLCRTLPGAGENEVTGQKQGETTKITRLRDDLGRKVYSSTVKGKERCHARGGGYILSVCRYGETKERNRKNEACWLSAWQGGHSAAEPFRRSEAKRLAPLLLHYLMRP